VEKGRNKGRIEFGGKSGHHAACTPGNQPDTAVDLKLVNHEILLSFWKVHVLHHAAEGEVIGNWMLEELRHHGYDVSPGTLYPLLRRMEKNGWLTSTADAKRGPKAPRSYRITGDGREVLKIVHKQLRELGVEVIRQASGL
jgi:PadR family transcriptional regulator, regulatory protein PadR